LKKASVYALILLLLGAMPAHAQMIDKCQQGVAEVDVRLDYTAPQENTTLTAAQIDAMFQSDARSTLATDRRGIYVGVTKSPGFQRKIDAAFGGKINVRQDAACVDVKKVSYTVVYAPEVYIASDFLRMACSYGVTLMHEKRHTDAYLQTINEYIPLLKKGIEDYFAHRGPQAPVKQLSLPESRQALMKSMDDSLMPVIAQFEQANYKRQAEIDTPANYAHDSAICPGQHPVFPAH
jgi:hypothetical protein